MNSSPYTIRIYEEEADFISKWTLNYPDIETGGDLYGLWLSETELIIQAVLGPGQNCRRTKTSFFQDEEYLTKVGGLLTRNEGLCHVGVWHSHHTMNHPEPCRHDQDIVWQQLTTPGKFLLLIATITLRRDGPKVQMSFSLFESSNNGDKITSMNCSILKGRSPIRANKAVSNDMIKGAEVFSKKTVYQGPIVASDITEVNNDLSEPETDENKPKQTTPEMSAQERDLESEIESMPEHKERENSEYVKGQDTERRTDRRLHHENRTRTCDGVGKHTDFTQNHYSRRRQSKATHYAENLGYRMMFNNLPNGRQIVVLYHYDHPVGHCEECRNVSLKRGKDGKFCAVDSFDDTSCCTIL